MSKANAEIKQIQNAFNYCPSTGILTWKSGRRAGTPDDRGYWRVMLKRKIFRLHRIAWLLTYGQWPSERLDHIDGNPSNNKIDNLRLATHQQNMHNRKVGTNNKSGVPGVHLSRYGTWKAWIQFKGKTIHLGSYAEKEDAVKVRKEAEKKYFGEFVRK